MPLCNLCQSTLDVFSIPKLAPDWNRWPVTSKKYTSLVSILNSRLIGIYREEKQTTGQNVDPVGLAFHTSLDELHAAAQDCAICSIVERDVARFQAEFEAQQNDVSARPELGGPSWRLWIARGKSDTGGFMVVSADKERDFRIWVVSAVGLCVDYDDPLGSLIRGRKVQDPSSSSSSSSSKALEHALNWVRECDEQRTNTRCHVDEAALPARVLDVNSDKPGGVALYEAKGQVGRYAALSHIMDETNPLTTTRAELEAHRKGIEVDKLPKTFSHAIAVARTMSIQYLWIDALCICQDDNEEWSRSSFRISSVYSNAYIVLSATGSSTDHEGLSIFNPNPPTPAYGAFSCTTNSLTGTVYAFSTSAEVASYSGHSELLAHEPLSQRAWALQERWLAPRILHFATKHMFYECYCHFLSSDGYYAKGRSDSLFPSAVPRHATTHSDDPRNQLRWQHLLGAYSRLRLTQPADKLPALSGLARTFYEQLGGRDDYVAGFWRKNLVESLIWQAVGTTWPSPVYRAPSWSWACIDGPFGMFCPDLGGRYKGDYWTEISAIVNCHVSLRDAGNPFGEIASACLEIRGPLEALRAAEGEAEEGFPDRQKGPRVKTRRGSERGTGIFFDTHAHAERARGRDLFALVLMRNVSSWSCGAESCAPRPFYHGIVVAKVEGEEEGTYERLGKIAFGQEELGQCEWMRGIEGEMTSISLV